MGSPAVMFLGSQFTGDGDLGTSPLGDGPLGGTSWTPFELPVPQPGSDRLDSREHMLYGEIVHERDGLIVGHLVRGKRGIWRQIWKALDRADAIELLKYADARRFYVLPDGNADGQKIVVLWRNAEVVAASLRGGYRTIDAEWIELTGPAALVV